MARYYVNGNAQLNGDREVHKEGCRFMPAPHNRIDLGVFASCHPAVVAARQNFTQVNGYFYCSNACHTI